MMTRSISINTPETEKLAHLKAISDAAQAHKYFQDNPKVIDQMAKAISGAYKLNEAEIKERDEAVAAVAEAKAKLKELNDEYAALKASAEKIISAAKIEASSITASANQCAERMKNGLDTLQSELEENQTDLVMQQGKLESDRRQLLNDQNRVREGQQKIQEWEKTKTAWEIDFTTRLNAVQERERKAVRG